MSRHSNERGFTLIELVVVITILGILAAFAVPRFAALEVEARIAAVEALGGSVRSSAALTHSLWLAAGNNPAIVNLEGGGAITMVNGYPDLATIDNTIGDLSGFSYDPATGFFQETRASGHCRVRYQQAAALGASPTITVQASVNGCR